MRIISFGDIHDNLVNLRRLSDLAAADMCVLAGDLTNDGSRQAALRVVDAVRAIQPALLAQVGNMDRQPVSDYLDETGINLHAQGIVAVRGLVGLAGVGGSNPTPFQTPTEYTEEQLDTFLTKAWSQIAHTRVRLMFVHAPPFGTAADRIRGGTHVGSTAVRDFVVRCQPDVLVCGHIHESRAIGELGETIVVNPGPFVGGGYVDIEVSQDMLRVALRNVADRARVDWLCRDVSNR